jgi:hypothetical protein
MKPTKCNLKVCDDGMLIQLWYIWKVFSIVLFLCKPHDVSETGFCLRLQVEPTQLDPVVALSIEST